MKKKTVRKALPFFILLLAAVFVVFWTKTPIIGRKAPSQDPTQERTASRANGRFQQGAARTAEQKPSEDPWAVWIEKQADIQIEILLKDIQKAMPFDYEGALKSREHLRSQIVKSLEFMAAGLKADSETPPPLKAYRSDELPNPPGIDEHSGPKKHEGPQTAQAIMETFQGMLTPKTVRDEKYPEAEWFEMLLKRGITIQDTRDYFGYQVARLNLPLIEEHPEMWTSGMHGVEPTADWETFKTDYVNRKIWEYEQKRAAEKADPTVTGGFFVGENKDTFLPLGNGRVYVRRGRGSAAFHGAPLTDEQKFNILFKGEPPEGYNIIYFDENSEILETPPPLITREELSPPDDWVSPDSGDPLMMQEPATDLSDSYTPLEVPVQNVPAPRQHPQDTALDAQSEFETFTETTTMTNADIEKMLEQEFLQGITPDKNSMPELQKAFDGENVSPARVDAAMKTLNRYGLEEGLRRLRKQDPGMAAQIRQKLRSQSTRHRTRNTQNRGTDAPQEFTP